MKNQFITFQNIEYQVTQLLGKGKSAYSWLCENGEDEIVLKQIHDEPCSYYEFADKYQSEIDAFQNLMELQIRIPQMLGGDRDKRWIFKEYIQGSTASALISVNGISEHLFDQLFYMGLQASLAGFNLDFFPNNFIVCENILYYIDYELNPYDESWNLQNWGLYYWINNSGMRKFLETGDASFINENPEKGIPIKQGLMEGAWQLIEKYLTQTINQRNTIS